MVKYYDENNLESIVIYAKKLEGLSFSEIIQNGIINNIAPTDLIAEEKTGYFSDIKAKGSLGQLIECYYFGYKPNSKQEADFEKVNLELKVVPLKQNKNKVAVKERVIITMVNFDKVVNEEFQSSYLLDKLSNILMVFYLHEVDKNKLEYKISDVYHYKLPEADLEIIKRDWELLKRKIQIGQAHNISEGDTFFLGACPKGADKNSLRSQPYSNILAMQRAFTLKQGYINYVYTNYVKNVNKLPEKIVTNSEELKSKSLEEIVYERMEKYIGKTKDELLNIFDIRFEEEPKNILSLLAFRALNITSNQAEEFVKANINVKTIRMNKSGKIKESMSFPAFKFKDIVKQDWESSELYRWFSTTKYFFIIYDLNDNDDYYLKKVMFWNMPLEILEGPVKNTWNETKRVIQNGLVISTNGKIRTNNLPGMTFNKVCHVRPHAKNKDDTYELPSGEKYTKQAFWLDNRYILNVINGSDK